MQNSTFVVNNPGTFGTIISVPIINQPHAAIMSMDAVVKRPVVIEDDAIAVRSMMYLCLSFDHRILDGAGAGGFLQAVRAIGATLSIPKMLIEGSLAPGDARLIGLVGMAQTTSETGLSSGRFASKSHFSPHSTYTVWTMR